MIYLSLLIISKEPKIYDEKYSENILFSEEIFDSLREGEVPNLIENIKGISEKKNNSLVIEEILKLKNMLLLMQKKISDTI